MNLSILLDVVVACLLVATIVLAVLLNRRLDRLRDGRAELAETVRSLAEATQKAEVAIRGLRQTASEAGDALQRRIDKAGSLRDELQLIAETADRLASRIEGAAGLSARPAPAPDKPVAGKQAAEKPAAEKPAAEKFVADRPAAAPRRAAAHPAERPEQAPELRSQAERDLLKALKDIR